MYFLLTALKTNKTLSSILGLITLLGGLLLTWDTLKDNIYQEGYQDAVTEYQVKIVTQHEKNIKTTNKKLQELRSSLQKQYQTELSRVSSERDIDLEVVEKITYIEKEIEIETDCNVIDTNLVSLFNKTIHDINKPSTD